MKLSSLTLLTLICAGVTSALKKSNHPGLSRPADSEYTTYSPSTVKVYNNDQFVKSTDNGNGSHYAHITAVISAFRQTFVLRLIKNRYLFASSYVERQMSDTGETYRQTSNMNAGHCYYIGSVDGHAESTASACTCYGFLGEFTVGSETYSVEPVEGTLTGRHRAYRESDSIEPLHKCGNSATNRQRRSLRNNIRKRRELKWPQDLDGETRFVELYVVNDFSQYETMGSDLQRTVDRAKAIVNAASALYHPESIYLVLVGVEVWTDADLITVNSTMTYATLDNFAVYRQRHISPYRNNDNAHLITGVSFDDNIIGLAYTYGMCNYVTSCAFTVDYHAMIAGPASTLAHEMGHNFGFDHDEDITPCACDDPSCIMSAVISDPPQTRWSQCSKDRLQESFDNQVDYCLHNVPQTIHDDTPDCGNAIVEQGEECDCGNAPASQCNPECCSACRLTTTASCAYGRCCDVGTCQLKSAYTECRAATSSCDLAEYCSGTDPLCPSDVYRRNTDSCSVDGVSAYCYNGECRSHQSQCRLWWGDEAKKSADDCYTVFNVRGEYGANCGYNITSETTAYFPCSSGNALCGSLQCDTSDLMQRVNFQSSDQSTLWRYVNGLECTVSSYVSFYNGPDRADPGFVPDGAVCGTGKMCLKQQCVDVSSIAAPDCGNCSLQGMCNTLGQCHCEIGFIPPDCSQPGGGGSYHSNAASPYPIPTTTTAPGTSTDDLMFLFIIIGAVVATIIIAAIIGIVIWRVMATRSSEEKSAGQRPVSSSAAGVYVSGRPTANSRFAPSQLHSGGYGGYDNNGYHSDEYSAHRNHQYPYHYRSRIDVHSDQFPPY